MCCSDACFPKPTVSISIKDSCNSECNKSCCCFPFFRRRNSDPDRYMKKVTKVQEEIKEITLEPIKPGRIKKKHSKINRK